MHEGASLFSSFSFSLDKGTLHCGDNFWSDFLCSIVLVVKAFQCQGMQLSLHTRTEVAYNLLDSMKHLAMDTILSKVLQPFSSFTEHSLHSPSTTMGSRRQPKQGKQIRWVAKEASKPSMGTCGQGWAANCTQYIFSPVVIVLVQDMEAPRLIHR